MSGSPLSGGTFDVSTRETRLAELDQLAGDADFWKDAEKAQAVLKERAEIGDALNSWRRQREGVEEIKIFLDLASEGHADAVTEAETRLREIDAVVAELELRRILGGEHDAGNAIVTLHPGAGGTEA